MVHSEILQTFDFLCALLFVAVLGSQGIVVKCTAAIFFSYDGLGAIFLLIHHSFYPSMTTFVRMP